MAETAKKRKQTKKTFFYDSDDDFSCSSPPSQEISKPSKLTKKKFKDGQTAVYTSTQGFETEGRTARRPRTSPDEKRFRKELEEALKLSTDENVSSNEICPVGSRQHNPSSADTLDVEDILTSVENEDGNSGRVDILASCVTEQEVILIDEDDSQTVSCNKSKILEDKKEFLCELNPITKTPNDIKISPQQLKKKKDGWILKPAPSEKEAVGCQENILSVVAQVHAEDNDEPVESRVPLPSPVPEEALADTVELDSPVKKRKRKLRILESDSDSDFGEEEAKRLREPREDKKVEEDDEEDEVSEDDYVPTKKDKLKKLKKERPTKKTKKSPGPVKPLVSRSVNVPDHVKPAATVTRIADDQPVKPVAQFTRITTAEPVKPAREPAKPATPVLDKGARLSLGTSMNQVKIPAWTPPARIGSRDGARDSGNQTPSFSPVIGLRLGLSRNIRVSKPLHSTVKMSD